MLDTLHYLHGRDLIHRDIAPDNVIVCCDGRPVLIDFGAVSRSHAAGPYLDGAGLSGPTSTVGIAKAHDTAPDQASARAHPDPTSDVCSVAAVLRRALSGEPPPEALKRVLGDGPCRPLADRALPGCPARVAAAVDAGLRVRKADRPPSIAAFREALGWTGEEAPATRPAPARMSAEAATVVHVSPAAGPARPAWRSPPVLLAAALALAAGMGAVAVHVGQGGPSAPIVAARAPVDPPSRGQRRILEMTAGSWVALREFNGLLLYTTHLVSYRCAIREVRVGVDSAVPDHALPLPPRDPADPHAVPADVLPYVKLPPATRFVSVELTTRDGSRSEVKT